MRLFKIENFNRLRQYSHIIWDIDGTITDEDGQINEEVAHKIIVLGLEGIHHSFITGRDADWIKQKVIDRFVTFFKFPDVRNRFSFYGEVGCVRQNVSENGTVTKYFAEEITEHPLRINQDGIRDQLRELVYDPDQLEPFHSDTKLTGSEEVIWDANGKGWIIDPTKGKVPPCHRYIWATSKEAFATFEKIRDEKGHVPAFDQDQYVEKMQKTINDIGVSKYVDLEVISTAINIVPKINGAKLGKAWAAGKALVRLWQKLGSDEIGLQQIVSGTIAAGDGQADLDFTTPVFSKQIAKKIDRDHIDIVFVGGRHDLLRANPNLIKNIIIQATGEGELSVHSHKQQLSWHDAKGARVISEVLEYLKAWQCFRPFM